MHCSGRHAKRTQAFCKINDYSTIKYYYSSVFQEVIEQPECANGILAGVVSLIVNRGCGKVVAFTPSRLNR